MAAPWKGIALALVWLACIVVAPALPAEDCTCSEAKATIGGWCAVHEVGYVAGVEVRASRVYEAVDNHGHDVEPTSDWCPTCQAAIRTDDFCEQDRVGFVGGKEYFSKLTYLLALGEVVPASEITCPTCRKNAESRGWCSACGIGMAGHVAIRNKRDFEEVDHALRILAVADETAKRCEGCAFAVLNEILRARPRDSVCPVCKIAYKDGARVAPAPPE